MKLFIELIKPRILSLSMMTMTLGYSVARVGESFDFVLYMWTFLGVGLSSAGAAALNHGLEYKFDALMERTKDRPLPSGKMAIWKAYAFGFFLVLIGSLFLVFFVNLLCLYLCLGTVFMYAFVYTPLKRISWINTYIGTIPGAMPILCGWAGAKGVLSDSVWSFFLVIAVWQLPHFFSIAWMYKESYKNAGFKMLTNSDTTGRLTSCHIIVYSFVLAGISFLPYITGSLGNSYAISMVFLNVFFLYFCFKFLFSPSMKTAKKVLRSSIIYPLLFMVFVLLDFVI